MTDINCKIENALPELLAWDQIALWFAEAAFSKAVRSIVANIFEKDRSFEELVPMLLRSIRLIIRQELDENLLKQLQIQVSGAKDAFIDYTLAPEAKDRLILATDRIGAAVAGLRGMGMLGYQSFILAQSLEIAMLRERREAFNRDSEITVLKRTIEQAYTHHVETSGFGWELPKFEISLIGTTNPESPYYRLNFKANLNHAHIAIHRYGSRDGTHPSFKITDANWLSPWIDGTHATEVWYRDRADYRWNNITYPTHIRSSEQVALKWLELLRKLNEEFPDL